MGSYLSDDQAEPPNDDDGCFFCGLVNGLIFVAAAVAIAVSLYYGLRASGYTLPRLH